MSSKSPSAELIVSPDQAGTRLDKLVVDLPDVGSRRRARQAIETGKVSVDGEVCGAADVGRKLEAGAQVSIAWSRPGTGQAKHKASQGLQEAGLEVIYEDAWIVAVNKPPGLLTDTANKEQAQTRDSLRARLQRYLRVQGDGVFVVHRIDRDTSGVVLLARTEQASQELRRQFRVHTPERRYLAVVHGVPDPAQGEWADWMAWDGVKLIQRKTPEGAKGAVRASTSVRTVAQFGRHSSLLELKLYTGRRNQIRLQAALRGHPLLGERLYLPAGWQRPEKALIKRQALHAASLVVEHPKHREPIRFEPPPPHDLQKLLKQLEQRYGRREI